MPAQQQHGHHEGRSGVADDLPLFFTREGDGLVITIDAHDEEPDHHQGQADEDAREQADHEQLGDGQAADGRTQQDEVGAGRDDGAKDGARGDDAARTAGLVAHFGHHGQQQAAQGRGFTHGAAHQTGKDHAGDDGGITKTAAHATDHELGQLHHSFGQATLGHDLAGKDKEGDGHEGIVVGPVQHGGGDDHAVPHAGMPHEHDGAQHQHHGDGDAYEQERKEAAKEKKKLHTLQLLADFLLDLFLFRRLDEAAGGTAHEGDQIPQADKGWP